MQAKDTTEQATPGPWIKAGYANGNHYITDEAGVFIASVNLVSSDAPQLSVANCNANASLIVAAPDLLEALKLCAAVCAGETLTKSELIHALEKASAAITKATQP